MNSRQDLIGKSEGVHLPGPTKPVEANAWIVVQLAKLSVQLLLVCHIRVRSLMNP